MTSRLLHGRTPFLNRVSALAVVLVIGSATLVSCTPTGAESDTSSATPSSSPDSGTPAVLGSDESLQPGQSMTATNGLSELVMQTDGNLVLYYNPLAQQDPRRAQLTNTDTSCDSPQCMANRPRLLWQSGTAGNSGASLTMAANGNMEVRQNDSAIWTSKTKGQPGATLQLTASGALEIVPAPSNAPNSTATASPATYRHGHAATIRPAFSPSVTAATTSDTPLWSTGTSTPTYAGSNLDSGETLNGGSYLQSPNGQYELTMSEDGALTLFNLTGAACPMWIQPPLSWVPVGQRAADGDEYGPAPVPGSYLTMQSSDGNLVLYPPGGGDSPWASGTTGNPGAYLSVQNDGNMVVYSSSGSALWSTSSETYLGSSLCSGEHMANNQKLLAQLFESCEGCGPQGEDSTRLEFATDSGQGAELDIVQGNGGNDHLWRSKSAPSDVYLDMQPDGNLVVYPTGSGDALWSTATSTPGSFAALAINGCLSVMTYSWDTTSAPGAATLAGSLTYEPTWSSCKAGSGIKGIGESEKISMSVP